MLLEIAEGLLARILGLVAMDGGRLDIQMCIRDRFSSKYWYAA